MNGSSVARFGQSRRDFLCQAAVVWGTALAHTGAVGRAMAAMPAKLHVAGNHYAWLVFYQRQGRDFDGALDAGIEEVAKSGLDGFEPIITAPSQIERLTPFLKKYNVEMRSLYVNSVLHEPQQAEKSIGDVLGIAEKAKAAGARIIVTNPSPAGVDKNDRQLTTQAAALDRLGQRLKSIGLTLAYHNHDVEMRNAAREFYHMMLATNPDHVTLCLDAHWIYRGAGNSAVALFDIVKLFGSRITELHLRQSIGNVWTETLCEGDIDFAAIAQYLAHIGVAPHLVIEQVPENGTPNTMDAVESHRRSRQMVDRLFGT